MRLPNKVTSFSKSLLNYLPTVVNIICNTSPDSVELFEKLKESFFESITPDDLIDILEILYILDKVDIDSGGKLIYVD